MLVDQLYVDVPTGSIFFLRRGNIPITKENGSPMRIGRVQLNYHSVVLVESDKVLLTKEQFFNRFPELVS